MRFHYVALALALAATSLTGCVGLGGGDDLEGATDDGDLQNGQGAIDYPDPIEKTPLDVSADASEVWIKPGDPVTLSATAPQATSVEWFLKPRDGPEGEGGGGGHDHGGGGGHGGHGGHGGGGHGGGDSSTIDTGDFEGGTRTDPIAFDKAGRYSFHCHPHPWMSLNVTVSPDAETSGVAHVALLDGDGTDDFRFAPNELDIQPGTEVIFWNNGTQVHTVTQDGFWERVGSGETLEIAPSEVGDYWAVALARDDATGWGTDQTRVLVDDNRPDDQKTWEPMEGQLTYGVPGNPDPEAQGEHTQRQHNFRSDYGIEELRLTFEATSDAPAEPSVKVSIGPQAQDALAEAGPAGSGEITLKDIDAGVYSIVVTGEEGAMIDYVINVEADLNLVPPLVFGGGGGGHGGHAH